MLLMHMALLRNDLRFCSPWLPFRLVLPVLIGLPVGARAGYVFTGVEPLLALVALPAEIAAGALRAVVIAAAPFFVGALNPNRFTLVPKADSFGHHFL
jgi:hypothetical protein